MFIESVRSLIRSILVSKAYFTYGTAEKVLLKVVRIDVFQCFSLKAASRKLIETSREFRDPPGIARVSESKTHERIRTAKIACHFRAGP